MLNLSKKDELLIFRSAGIGDFMVILPFINYLINIIGIPKKKIHFVIINNQNLNPLKLIFEEEDCLVKNSTVLNPYKGYKEIKRIRSLYIKSDFTKIIYLPFVNEPLKSKIKKYISIKFISGGRKHVYGLNFQRKSENIGTQYLTYFEQLGLKKFNNYLNFNISDITNFSEFEILNSNAINVGKKNIALYINSKLEMKIWDQLNFFKIIEYISNNYDDVNIYLIGGADDVEYNDKFIDKFNLRYVENIAGQLSIRETILLLNKFELLIGNDGSPIHMAAYSNTSIIGIYTYKEEIGSWAPFKSDRYITLTHDVNCKHCYLEFCENSICIEQVSPSSVIEAIDELLHNKNLKIKRSVVI